MFGQDLLNPGVRRREVLGWSMYDFANSGYTTVVLTAVYNAYFVAEVAKGQPSATLLWTVLIAVSSLIVMVTMPGLGAWADAHGAKKRLLAFCTGGCVITTAALACFGSAALWWAAAAVVLSNVFFSYGESLIAAFLPELARRNALGRVSGWGWAFGYLGGMLALGLCLVYVLQAQARGQAAADFVPITLLITAGLYLIAAIPTFLLMRERADPCSIRRATRRRSGLSELLASWQRARAYPDFLRLLACGTAYQAGIAVVIALAAVYADQALGFSQAQTMALVFLVNIASAIGAFAFGYYEDRIGHQPALAVTLVGWMLMTVLAFVATSSWLFWIAALIAGLCMGSSQSCGRALAGALAPHDRLAEFFGLWTFATRLAAIIGPLTYGAVTVLTAGNHRLAILSTGLFFVAGYVLLKRVDMTRGMARALV
ncbi:MFS transporter [Roseateles depolymerans]|uniref:Major facilitator superfamily permease n=1 Tax=Roseateles depolymerans TaxID=76731 RepID=A0A0U3MC62_9BURK|nr:MFS transporter [Roseateles depolymerans]ALV05945.1 Major facilitator superfamily permease [Roseateles depolymerans]REG09356.1 UMF1 family MFS transporter [Roseateles depolymerans]